MKKRAIFAIIIILILLVIVGSGFGLLTSDKSSPLRPQTLDLTPTPEPTPAISPLSLYLVYTPQPTIVVPGNLAKNPSFEHCTERSPGINVPIEWSYFFTDTQDFKLPEWGCSNLNPDYPRVTSGNEALKMFAQWKRMWAGVYQPVFGVIPGNLVIASANVQVWTGYWCPDSPGYWLDPPIYRWPRSLYGDNKSPDPTINCKSDIIDPHNLKVRIGISPNGGTNPWSQNIAWSIWYYPLDVYQHISVMTIAKNDRVTVWLEAKNLYGVKINDLYVDDAAVIQVPQLTPTPTPTITPTPAPMDDWLYLPLVLKNYRPISPTPTPTPMSGPTPTPYPHQAGGPVLELAPVPSVVSLGDIITITSVITNLSRPLVDVEIQLAASSQLEILEVIPGPFLACTKEMRVLLSPIVFDCAGGPSFESNGQLFEIIARAVGQGQASVGPLSSTSVFVEFVSSVPDDPDNLQGGIANPITRDAVIIIRQ